MNRITKLIIGAGMVGSLAACGVATTTTVSTAPNGGVTAPVKADWTIKVGKTSKDILGDYSTKVAYTNNTKSVQSECFTISYLDASGGPLGTGTSCVSNVAPAQTVTDTSALGDDWAGTPAKVTVTAEF